MINHAGLIQRLKLILWKIEWYHNAVLEFNQVALDTVLLGRVNTEFDNDKITIFDIVAVCAGQNWVEVIRFIKLLHLAKPYAIHNLQWPLKFAGLQRLREFLHMKSIWVMIYANYICWGSLWELLCHRIGFQTTKILFQIVYIEVEKYTYVSVILYGAKLLLAKILSYCYLVQLEQLFVKC